MSEVFLNGSFVEASQARISPMDRGFLFADGIYEVIPVFNGVLFRAEQHLRRLERSLDGLQIPSPHSVPEWMELCRELVRRNGGGELSLYMQVTRGAPDKRDHPFPYPVVPPTVFMSATSITRSPTHDPDAALGFAAITLDDIRWGRCDIKSVSLLPNVLAKQQAYAMGAAEAILIRDGLVTEGASTNVFLIKDGRIGTPPRSTLILNGITRELIIELCDRHRIALVEREIAKAELYDADEIWISSSTKDITPIVSVDTRKIGHGVPGELWKSFARRFVDYKLSVCSRSD